MAASMTFSSPHPCLGYSNAPSALGIKSKLIHMLPKLQLSPPALPFLTSRDLHTWVRLLCHDRRNWKPLWEPPASPVYSSSLPLQAFPALPSLRSVPFPRTLTTSLPPLSVSLGCSFVSCLTLCLHVVSQGPASICWISTWFVHKQPLGKIFSGREL